MSARGIVARALARLWLRPCDVVGGDVELSGRPWIQNAGRLVVGRGVRIASRTVQSHLVVSRGATLEIGDGVAIEHGAAIAAHASVFIGEGARIGPYAVISDTDFHVAGDGAASAETAPVTIGRGAVIGARVTVLRGSVIGDGARVVAGSVVSGVVPAGATVAGVPARLVAAGRGAAEVSGATAERVASVVTAALDLAAPPPPDAGPADIPEWDSLGALRLLLALEDAFAVRLDEAAMPRVRRVADLAALVDAAREHSAG